MPAPNPLAIFAPGLNQAGIMWMAVGSIASNAYGEVRTTNFREGGSEKHLRDIRGMVAATDIDRGFLEEIAERNLMDAWRKCQSAR